MPSSFTVYQPKSLMKHEPIATLLRTYFDGLLNVQGFWLNLVNTLRKLNTHSYEEHTAKLFTKYEKENN